MQMSTCEPMLLRTGEAARLLGLNPDEMEALIQNGSVPMVQLPGGAIRFSPEGLRRWVEAQQRQPVAG